ncbi:MAG TPA: 3-oxoacyl-ACP reductase family protein [Solirubrobacteraceae bacterium]|nr:3-oxoacyl-ACP reductase family protein [Solirubrobacteraceae bacterium]
MSGGLEGRVALVTGGGRGIGRAIALAFAQQGADVALCYRERADSAAEVVAEIETLGRRALAVRADVSSRDDVRAMAAAVVEAFGGVDVLVNNAGILQQKPFSDISDDDWDRMLAVNLRGPFICSQELLPLIAARGGGQIINIASSGGQLGGPLAVHYSASKAAVISLTRSLARIAAPGITVNCVSGGLIETEMTRGEVASEGGRQKLAAIPLARLGAPDDVAAAVMFLACSANYVTGQTINVNGGLYLG